MAKKILAVVFGFVLAPAFISADSGLSGAFGPQIVGGPCAVRVYHTNFRFPPQGGKIVQVGNELYFIRTYLFGCANAGAGFPTVVASNSSFNPAQLNPEGFYVNPAYGSAPAAPTPTPTQMPAMQAPVTGGSGLPTCY